MIGMNRSPISPNMNTCPLLPRQALNNLCRAHWHRLVSIGQSSGLTLHDAEDLAQDTFVAVLRAGDAERLIELPEAMQSVHLKVRLSCLLRNRWRDARCLKRAGGVQVPLDEVDPAESRLVLQRTPATEYDRLQLFEMLDRALARLRKTSSTRDWHLIRDWVVGGSTATEMNERTSVANRVAMHRAKSRLRGFILEEAGATSYAALHSR